MSLLNNFKSLVEEKRTLLIEKSGNNPLEKIKIIAKSKKLIITNI